MTWKLVEISQSEELPDVPWPIGTCFRVPIEHGPNILDEIMRGWRSGLSIGFLHSGRDFVWVIVMPSQDLAAATVWVPDIKQGYQEFEVAGDDSAEHLTVTPKINLEGIYFGQIVDGHILDDETGRVYR